MRRGLLLSAALALVMGVSSADPATRPPRFLLALAAGGTVSLLQSSDGVRWAAAPGYAPGPGTAPAPVRRGSTLYLYDSPSLSGGTLRRFAVGTEGRLSEQAPAAYQLQLAFPEDAQRASAGSFSPSFAVDDDGALVLLYALRFEPETNACPVAGQACLKLRTATEVSGSDGTVFTGDPGNRIVVSFDPGAAVGPPALLRTSTGWAALFRGADACLHVVTATDPRKQYRDAGCATTTEIESPSALWDRRLREYRLYGVAGGDVVRAVSGRLTKIAPQRFRPLALSTAAAFARIAAAAP